jgi:uncharacterized protein YegP (UPF0339 family)
MIKVKKNKDNQYKFVVTAKSGNSLLKSIPFSSREELDATVKQLQPLVEKPSLFERKTSHSGKFHFALKNKEGDVIGISKSYTSEAGMENGITNLKKRITSLDQSQIP